VLGLVAFAVAVTVAVPGGSVTVDEAEISHWSGEFGGSNGALTMLIEAAWAEGEASERGIVVSDAEVREATEEPRPTADERFLARNEILDGAIKEQVTRPAALSVTPDQVKAYVDQHPRTLPEQKFVRRIVARSRQDARRAKRALRNGGTWSLVAKRYSTTPGAGLKPARTAEEQAPKGVLQGPVKANGRYTVFEVVKVTPERPVPRGQQEATAWEILASEAQERALEAFKPQFADKWRGRTTCAPKYASHRDCGNTQQPPSGGVGT
jgi:foldase protein PrsA